MPNLIQNFSNNNQPQKFFISPVTDTKPAAKNLPAKKPVAEQSPKDRYFNSSTIIASLAGLAVLAGGVWGIQSGKIKLGSKRNTLSRQEIIAEIGNIKERISDIKNILVPEFTHKKQKIIKELNKFGEYDYKLPFSSIRELKGEISVRNAEHQRVLANSKAIIADNKQIIKGKLEKLMQDPEWQELKNTRKALIKTVKAGKSLDDIKIANKKVSLVNDLLINKAYPERSADFKRLYGIDDNQALQLIRTPFKTYDEYVAAFKSKQNHDIPFDYLAFEHRFSHKNKLQLKDVFPVEAEVIYTNEKLIESTKKDYDEAVKLYERYREKILSLASEFRQYEETVELKQLIIRLKELRAALNNAS